MRRELFYYIKNANKPMTSEAYSLYLNSIRDDEQKLNEVLSSVKSTEATRELIKEFITSQDVNQWLVFNK